MKPLYLRAADEATLMAGLHAAGLTRLVGADDGEWIGPTHLVGEAVHAPAADSPDHAIVVPVPVETEPGVPDTRVHANLAIRSDLAAAAVSAFESAGVEVVSPAQPQLVFG